MILTEDWLTEHCACQEGMDWFKDQTDSIKVVKKLHTEARSDWANWLLVRLMNRKQQLRYAINAAELALPWWEKQYPDDKSPRLAIEAARAVLANDTEETRAAAESADYAVRSADYAAAPAAAADYAAYAAAWSAAWSADYAAWSAACAAVNAAGNAARNAADAGVPWSTLLEYGIELLESEEKHETNN